MKSKILVLFAALFSFSQPALSQDVQTNTWETVAFDTPIAFSAPQKVGLGAAALTYPAETAPGQAQMEITLVAVPKGMQDSFGNDDLEISRYVRATFLGISKDSDTAVKREFLGNEISGDTQSVSIPKAMVVDFFLVPLEDGDKIAVAFSRETAMDEKEAMDVMDLVGQSFRLQ